MADLVLNQYLPDVWYEAYRSNIDVYIDHFGQEIRLLKRTETQYNIYSDIVRDISTATTEKSIINRSPSESYFLAPPFTYLEESPDTSYFAYFKRSSLVMVDDIVVIESRSVDGDIVLNAFEVSAIKGKRLEQEFIRRFILTPFRDQFSEEYEEASVLTEDEIIEAHLELDVVGDPGGFTDKFYDTKHVAVSPGTENFVTPDASFDESLEDLQETYETRYPENWQEGAPYDVGKPIKRGDNT